MLPTAGCSTSAASSICSVTVLLVDTLLQLALPARWPLSTSQSYRKQYTKYTSNEDTSSLACAMYFRDLSKPCKVSHAIFSTGKKSAQSTMR